VPTAATRPGKHARRPRGPGLLALSQIAPPGRLRIVWIELMVALRALLWMCVPVPCRPGEDGQLRVASHAMLGLTYPREAIQRPLPGAAFVQVLQPEGVWLPSVGVDQQPLCLGPQLPCGIPTKEVVLMTYGRSACRPHRWMSVAHWGV